MKSLGPRVEDTEKVRSDDRLGIRFGEVRKRVLELTKDKDIRIKRYIASLGPAEMVQHVVRQRFRKKMQKLDEELKTVGVSLSLYIRRISSSITTKLVSKCNGERVLTLRQKEIRNLLRIAEHMRGGCNDEKQVELWTSNSNWLNREIHQVDLAMKLVSSPLHHTQDTGGPLTEEEEQMSRLEKYLLSAARSKMPPRFESLLRDKLMERFGPMFDMFVRELVQNITMQLFMPWHEYMELYPYSHLCYLEAYFPTKKDIFIDLKLMLGLIVRQGYSAEGVAEAIVKKMELGFAEACTPEDKLTLAMHKMSLPQLTLDMHKMSLAQPQED